MPLYSGGLCEAVIITPALNFLAAKASVGVGKTPASTQPAPPASTPEIRACFRALLEVRVSPPTTTLPYVLPTASPNLKASRNRSPLTSLLIPEVPNIDIALELYHIYASCQPYGSEHYRPAFLRRTTNVV